MTQLARTLTYRDLLLLIVGAVIGSGIFLVPGEVLAGVRGSVGLAMLVWILGGVLSLLGALTYGEMAAMKPDAGGLYVFIRDCFGPMAAFLFGWTLFLVMSSAALATLSVAFSNYLNELVALGDVQAKIISVLMIAVVTLVNVRGTRQGADLMNWTTLAKTGALLLLSVALLALGKKLPESREVLWPAEFDFSLLTAFGGSMIAVLWAYEAWQYATFSAGETRNPQKDFPRAFLLGMFALIGIYVFANVAYLAALGPEGVAASQRIAASAVAAAISPDLAKVVAVAIMLSVFSAANSIPLTAPRVFFAMAQDGLFFRKLAEVHPRFGTPAISILVSGAWACLLAANATFQQLYTYVIFASWIFYGLGAACIFVYRKREPRAARPYRVPGYPWTPLIFVIAAAALVVNTIAVTPKDTNFIIALGVMFAGVPAYFLWRKANGRA
jgi:APA family basic amino acid/polyamine antiporter